MKDKQPSLQERLQARRLRLEQEERFSSMRMQNNLNYIRNDAAQIIGSEVVTKTSQRSPIVGALLGKVIQGKRGASRTTILEHLGYKKAPTENTVSSVPWLDKAFSILSMILPFFIFKKRFKLLRFVFLGAGKPILFLLKQLVRLFIK